MSDNEPVYIDLEVLASNLNLDPTDGALMIGRFLEMLHGMEIADGRIQGVNLDELYELAREIQKGKPDDD